MVMYINILEKCATFLYHPVCMSVCMCPRGSCDFCLCFSDIKLR